MPLADCSHVLLLAKLLKKKTKQTAKRANRNQQILQLLSGLVQVFRESAGACFLVAPTLSFSIIHQSLYSL